MIIYSVTVSIDSIVESDWLFWMKRTHIPDMLSTGIFIDGKIHRLLDPPPHEPDVVTYNIQYSCATMDDYLVYQEQFASEMQEKHTKLYKDRFVAFRTLLERL